MGLSDAIRLRKSGRLLGAEAACRKVLEERPTDARACHLLGMIAHDAGRHEEAVDLMRRSIRLAPSAVDFQCNLGALLGRVEQYEEAAGVLRAVLRRNPRHADAHNNLGVALERTGRAAEALEHYRTAARLRPGNVEALHHLANAARKLGKLAEAEAADRQAIAARPVESAAWRGLAETLGELGHQDEVIEAHRQAIAAAPNEAAEHSNLLFCLHYSPGASPAQRRVEARQWASRHTDHIQQLPRPDNEPDPDRPLRVGYLSPDFRAHTIATLMEPILEGHDRRNVRVFCYSAVRTPDPVTRRLRALADEWRDVARTPDQTTAERIRHDRIDVLIELAGHMGGNRLAVLARRPAPVQVQLGYAGTTGMSQVDYRLTDWHCDPAGAEAHYTEELVRMPRCVWPYRPPDCAPPVGPLPSLEVGRITFGCLNKLIKVSDDAIALWSRILLAIPSSRLLLLAHSENARVLEQFAKHGVGPERLGAAARRTFQEYLALFNRMDVALDPLPYNGDTTTCDGLWMGVPLVTLAGDVFVSRRGVSHLSNVGLPELIASTPDEYVRIACELARDAGRLMDLRGSMRQRMRSSPLLDGRQYAGDVEAAYRDMWRRWCASQNGR